LREVGGALGIHHHDGRGAVVLHAAVEQVERLDDPARRVVLGCVQRLAMHHGARVRLRMVVGRQRDGAQRLLPDAVLVHVALHRMAKRCGGEITP
jgi:hypothetical protein